VLCAAGAQTKTFAFFASFAANLSLLKDQKLAAKYANSANKKPSSAVRRRRTNKNIRDLCVFCG
jgi:hypothetical protein